MNIKIKGRKKKNGLFGSLQFGNISKFGLEFNAFNDLLCFNMTTKFKLVSTLPIKFGCNNSVSSLDPNKIPRVFRISFR